MQKHQAHVLGSCTVFGIFIIVLYLFSGNNIDRKGLSIIVFLFIWTKLVLSHNSPCLIIPTLTLPGMIIVGICGTAIIVFLCVTITAVFQYLYRVNENPAICAVFKYIITYFVIIYAILKVTYLFHFAYLMYRTYTQRPFQESKTLLYFYDMVTAIAGTICTVLVIVIDLLHERTVFAMHNGYCAEFFHDPRPVYIVLFVVLTVTEITLFVIAITLYYLTTKRFCTCGSMTGPNNFRVSITLILAIGLEGILLVILLLAGVAGGSSVIASTIAACVEQVILLIIFLTSMKIRAKLRKFFERN